MRKTGIVKKAGERAEVVVIRESACGENCADCKGGCTPGEMVIIAENLLGAEEGDKVVLEMQDKNALKAAFIAYIIPLIALIAASCILSSLGYSDGMVALCGLGVMAVILLAVKRISAIKADMFKVKIVDILG